MSRTYNMECPKCKSVIKLTQNILDYYKHLNVPVFHCPDCDTLIEDWENKLVFVDTEKNQREAMEYAFSDEGMREYYSRYSSYEEFLNDTCMSGLHYDAAYSEFFP